MAEKIRYFYDDFSSWDSEKWWKSDVGDTITVTGGQLQITPTNAYHYMHSTYEWDAVASAVSFKIIQNANEGLGSIGTTIAMAPEWENGIEFEIDGGSSGTTQIKCHDVRDSVYDTVTFTYDPAVTPWIRLRNANAVNHWEISSDGIAWTTIRTLESVVDMSLCNVRVSSYFWDAETDPGTVILDNMNLHGGVPGRPKASTLTDDFGFESSKWIWDSEENHVVDGQLHMLSWYDEDHYSPLYSSTTYDLTDSHFSIELVQDTPFGNESYINDISIGPDLNNCVFIRFGGPGSWVSFTERVAGVDTSGGPIQIDPARHRWFRIREESGTLYWDTSIDGIYWINRWSKTTVVDLTASLIRLYCAPYDVEEPATVIWDNVNLHTGNTIGPEIPFKAELFTDNFSEDTGAWYGSEGILWVDGTLQCSPTNEYQWFTCKDFWDLTDSHCMWEMKQNALAGTSGWDGKGTTSTEFIVSCAEPANTGIRFAVFGGDTGVVECQERFEGVNDDSTFVYDAKECRYLRLRESGGMAYWETSPNSITWTIRRQTPVPEGMDLSNVKFDLSIGYWDDENEEGPLGTVILDNFNISDLTLASAIGWTRSDALSFGGRETGTVQPRKFFEEADWLWNPIPDNPVLDPLSSEIANSAVHDPTIFPPPDHGTSFMAYGNTLVHPNMIKPDTPRYFMYMDVVDVGVPWDDDPYNPTYGFYDHPFPEYGTTLPGIPIPYGIKVPPGSDCHMVVADPVTGKVFSFWQVRYKPETDQWRCTYGGIADYHGDGRDYSGSATATNISRYACQATIAELQAGEIPHALFVVSNACSDWVRNEAGDWIGPGASGTRYPAQKSDGHNYAGAEYPIDQGTRLQLDPSIDLNAIPMSPAERAVGKCWQKYGAYVLDSGGRDYPPVVSGASISELWQGQDYPLFPFGEWGVEIFAWGYDLEEFEFILDGTPNPPPYTAVGLEWDYYAFRKIPWAGNVRVLKHWHGGE